MGDITVLLQRARDGEQGAWDDVVALIYQDLKLIARRVIGRSGSATINPTGLVHDCYLRLSKAGPTGVLNRDHFLALAARAMRQLMLNHARDRLAAKRGGGAEHTEGDEIEANAQAEDLIELDQALRQLASVDERMVQVVECRVFAGLSEAETAAALEMPLRSSQRLYAAARERLAQILTDAKTS